MHVTYLWHMHQPIYYPYESPQTIDANGRFNFSVQGVWDGDRVGAYQTWPKDAVQAGADRGLGSAGAQMSYSGSLAENNNNLWGFCTGSSWDDSIDWARNGLRTSLNNPRLDLVGIAYHHSLMPLTCKESMIMQIRLHKEQYKQLWDTTGYSKGFWPPECAFAEWMIPALVEEGLEWVIVDNGHLFRAVPDFPWSSASSCRVNPAEIQNPSSTQLGSAWVQLLNVWAPTKVLAPWSYQPHHVQWVNPSNGAIQKIVAVPAGRYEGNENGRGGYGAFKPENVWGAHVSTVNTDWDHPMLLVCHSDGDNYGMKNSDAWHGQHGLFLDMIQANGDFDHTTIQDYLDQWGPETDDIIHVEPGSWIGIDGGTPYFEKWLSSTYVNGDRPDGENPDRWSWSVLVAAQNMVLLADSLENSYLGSNPNMDDVEWGINNDTARAWHWYLVGETSCYWYWDLDRGNPWDGNVTRACNAAIGYAGAVTSLYPGVDNRGPSIFPPQRDPYNPGGYMWDEPTPASPDFEVWSYVFDANGLSAVRLYWRTDLDGLNPIGSTDNETYAGGSEVNGWNTNDITSSGDWDPKTQGPVVPDPARRAKMYSGFVTGQNQVLIDYFIEAVDTQGNTNRSDIYHVYVGQYNATNAVPVTFAPSVVDDCDGSTLTVTYNAAGRSLSGDSPVILLINYSNESTTNALTMSGTIGGLWYCTSSVPSGAQSAKVMFRNSGSTTHDNNGGNGWTRSINACYLPSSVTFNPEAPNGCVPVTITYSPGSDVLAGATQVYIHVGYNDWQGVPTPDPAMAQSSSNWTYTYWPPAGAYCINCVFNDGAGTWDNNNGSDYGVTVTNCVSTNAVVVFSPGAPTDCDGSLLAVTYSPAGRPLEGTNPVYMTITFDDWSTWAHPVMFQQGTNWVRTNAIPAGTTSAHVNFRSEASDSPGTLDDNGGLNWSVAVSSCQTSGPSAVVFDPPAPVGCDDVVITYYPNEGPLKGAAQVYMHLGRNGWKDVSDPAMTQAGGTWVYTNSLLDGTYQINCCFNNGGGTWDNNNGNDWAVTVTGCTSSVPEGIRFAWGTPQISDDPPTNQNVVGDAFDLSQSGGFAETTEQGGFGSFGQVYVNYDSNSFYIGAYGCDVVGTNNGMILFLGFNTLGDNVDNLWALTNAPNSLDFLHNVTFARPMDLALVLGDEWGDGTFTNFNLGDGEDFGQGVYYLSSGEGRFVPVPGSKLSQFDGAGTGAALSNDDDTNRLTDRWECSISWNSLGAAEGINSVTNGLLCGLFANSSVDGNNRYLSGNYLGTSAVPATNANYEFNMVHLDPIEVGLPLADSDGDGIADWWERQYFSSLGVMSRFSDWDGDGMADREESYAGTHPKDAASCFQCYTPAYDGGDGGFLVRWHSVAGRTYDLYCSTNLQAADGGFELLETAISATPSENIYTDTVAGADCRFYRVRTGE
ncbi:MAG: hypothetical protein JXB04_02235 [Kiritimatiellae bacterium]|nr:hypothetical protein [Kiritimatiellia bacterium]